MVAVRSGRVLSIETGYSCNALCGFCPQVTFRERVTPQDKVDETTEEIKARIKAGADEGCTQLGFSGGEPTIREDFVELVAYGKSLGYELIAVTTNGFRFSYLSYARTLVEAGLNSINISIHGGTAKTHNAMMRTPNAFEMAVKGVKNLQKLQRVLGRRIDFMSMCLAAPQVLKEFPEHIRLMGELGIRLHMVQPLLINPGNSNFADRMMSSYEDIAKAIREGVEVAKLHGGHIKLFNTPVCMFWDIEEHLERQRQSLEVARVQVSKTADVNRLKSVDGYYRIDDCRTCVEPCNGFRIEYHPQEKILDDLKKAIVFEEQKNGSGEIWVGGTELLEPETWNQLMRFAKELKIPRLSILTEGLGRTYGEFYTAENLKHIDELAFLVRGRRKKNENSVPYLQLHGNLVDIEKALVRINRFRERPCVSATLFPGDLSSKEICRFVEQTSFDTVRIFCHYSPYAVELFVCWLFFRWRILRAAKRFRSQGKKVILMGARKPFFSGGFAWESFWDRWVRHAWLTPPHPDITQPLLWTSIQRLWESWRLRRSRNQEFLGPAPLAHMPESPKTFK